MQNFYHQVRPSEKTMAFYAKCALCGKQLYGVKIPVLCRGKKRLKSLEEGCCGKLSQKCYNRGKANAVQRLAMQFNRCCVCSSWVCDDCFEPDVGNGACKDCAKNIEREKI